MTRMVFNRYFDPDIGAVSVVNNMFSTKLIIISMYVYANSLQHLSQDLYIMETPNSPLAWSHLKSKEITMFLHSHIDLNDKKA